MTFVTHAAAGLGLAAMTDQSLLLGVAFSLLPDLDHLLKLKTWRFKQGGFNAARTYLHELIGLAGLTTLGLFLALIDSQIGFFFILCISMHYFMDFINGKSIPYLKVRNDAETIDFGKSLSTRIIQEISLGVLFLWIFITNYIVSS